MEKVAEALARVRGADESVVAGLRASRAALAPITYTHTRRFEPDVRVLRENRVLSAFAAGPLVDAYKILSIQVLQRLRQNKWNSLAVVSPGSGEGRTLTAVNLAISLSHEVDQTVLLVDADLRNPGVHKAFGLGPHAGLSDHLVADVPLEELLVNPAQPRLVLLPGGRPLVHSAEMLGSTRMAALVRELKSRYPSRIVLFDLPPILSAADVLAFAPHVDAAALVVAEARTAREDIARTVELLGELPVVGVVLNRSRGAGVHV